MSSAVQTTKNVFQSLVALDAQAGKLREGLPGLTDEHLKTLFQGLDGASEIAWQLQADIIAELQTRASYGSNAVKEIARFLGIKERRAYELAQIANEIFKTNPELRNTPLEKSHYLVALRGKRYGKDPIQLLESAADLGIHVAKFKRIVDGSEDKDAVVRTTYFVLSETADVPENADVIQQQYLSPMARVVSFGGRKLLELKEEK